MTQLPGTRQINPPPPQMIDPVRIDTGQGQAESRQRRIDMSLTNWLLGGILSCTIGLFAMGLTWEIRYQKAVNSMERRTKEAVRQIEQYKEKMDRAFEKDFPNSRRYP